MNYDEEGLKAARRVAAWNLGDASWAGMILSAYFHPEATNRSLDDEMREDD